MTRAFTAARSDLQWVLPSTEEAIAGLVTAFGELTKDTDSILHLASAPVVYFCSALDSAPSIERFLLDGWEVTKANRRPSGFRRRRC